MPDVGGGEGGDEGEQLRDQSGKGARGEGEGKTVVAGVLRRGGGEGGGVHWRREGDLVRKVARMGRGWLVLDW